MTARFFKITKKPRETPLADIPIRFPKLENLHLELLEVKDKLKKNLPPIPISKPQINFRKDIKPQLPQQDHKSEGHNKEDKQKRKEKKRRDKHRKKEDRHDSRHRDEDRKHKSEKSEKSKSKVREEDEDDELVLELGEDTPTPSQSDKKSSKDKKHKKDKKEPVKEASEESEESSSEEEETDDKDSEEEASSEEEDTIDTQEVDIYAGLSPEERLEMEKEEYVWKFRLLKKQFGKSASIPIPEFNEHSDLGMMKKSYERTIKELYLDDAVETYRTYLLGGWIVMEYVCTQFLEIDLEGFTLQQIKMMHKYDRMLIELGEKSYTRWGMNLPVEIRLLGMILFQAGIFYLAKIVSDKFGGNVGEIFRGMTGQPPPPEPLKRERENKPAEPNKPAPKSRMRGPRINADDIRQSAKEKEADDED